MKYDLYTRAVTIADPAICRACGPYVRVCPDEVLVLGDGMPVENKIGLALGYPAVEFRRVLRCGLASLTFV